MDAGVHVGAFGVPHRHTTTHPALVDPIPQLGLGHGQLGPVVHAGRLHRIVGDEGLDPVAGVVEHGIDAGQRMLTGDPLGTQSSQGGRHHRVPEAVDGGGDLVDIILVADLGTLDDADDGVVLAPHDTVVAGGIGKKGGEERGRRTRVPVLSLIHI